MDKENFNETLQHGTTAFPIAIYHNSFEKQQHILAYLHYHNEFELLIATKGSLCVQIEETTYFLSQGDGIFINSGLLHNISSNEDCEHGFIAVVFDYTLLCNPHEITYSKYIYPLINHTLDIPAILPKEVCTNIFSLYSMYKANIFGSELFIKQCLFQIMYILMKNASTSSLSAHNSKSLIIKEVLDYMKKNYAQPISLQLLADHVHVSKEYLCRLFHTLSDSSPIEYLNQYRIQQSTFLLLQTNKSISDIALSCGFNHSSYYGKLFLQYMGYTPTEYRKNFR